MTAFDLAIVAGMALIAGWLAYWLRRRRAATRLARLTRASAVARVRAGSDAASGAPGAAVPGGRGSRRTGRGDLGRRAEAALLRRPVTAGGAAIALLCGAALLLAGPVAAVVAALYALMALVTVRRRLVRQEGERRVAALLDAVDATAEGLRAGTIQDGTAAQTSTSAQSPRTNAMVPSAMAAGGTAAGGKAAGRQGRWAEAAAEVAQARLEAAYRLSEALGVPLADLLDRVDADLRSGQALRGGVAAQLSAAQATSAVLLALPLAGLWVGAALNTHPVRQLLHTPLGAACAVVAVALQCGGFLWTVRMVHAATAEVR
ncbi:hypothetical protein ABT297_08630 [Dactylosporangium sp. NPDC000555]|uniref:type II secretion system F family protein n=1 Tax=Dactylosporangium sp. NPDC000555 TaxID=3154260 RepID=UPI00331A665F